jgi:hypothetical protein
VSPATCRLPVTTSCQEPASSNLLGANINRVPAASSCVSRTRVPIPCVTVLVVLFLLNLREPFFTGACFLSPCSFSSGLHPLTPPLSSVAHPSPLFSNCAPPLLPVQQSGLLDSQPCLETHRMSLHAEQTKLALGLSGMSLLHNSSEE